MQKGDGEWITCSKGPQVGFKPWAAAARTQPQVGLDVLPTELPGRPSLSFFFFFHTLKQCLLQRLVVYSVQLSHGAQYEVNNNVIYCLVNLRSDKILTFHIVVLWGKKKSFFDTEKVLEQVKANYCLTVLLFFI